MPRRPLLAAATTLSTLLLLTACNGSPEAGRPNSTPNPSSPTTGSPSPTKSSSAPSTPAWTQAEQAAITAAKARYVAARAAVDKAFNEPVKAKLSDLEAAGNGGSWVLELGSQLDFHVEHGWYQDGKAKVVSLSVRSANMKLVQPEVRLTACVDSSQVVSRYQSNSKPVPVVSNDGTRHQFESRLVYAQSNQTGKKMWFVVDEKTSKSC
ncbi:hypothetical protein JOF29_004068 [Kribbella aluminosa]|uniref:Lipoprotein n=1 Tax=Kribbella aluminosa TaxID=416017 RepID=A0ABS4UMX2_9ACTN|nr:hypothetical protein [Kribbella aluminosa]MBP2352985.1 hypothetical protein [Kribbella aluminosa]